MKYSVIKILLLVILFSVGCESGSENKLADNSYKLLTGKCQSLHEKDFLVYYFDGDCSVCYAKVLLLKEQYPEYENRILLVAKTQKPQLLLYNLNANNVKYCLTIDSTGSFGKEANLGYNKVTFIKKDRTYVVKEF
ncbi:hypothetical protein [Filimonas effusa]|uniref:hypothetical protein n=1 Tax=Filimonas effusa TaxID=2508721 RepID=UPI0013E93AEF|nr:hypothetical protein [Filimonas effusa]